MSAPAPPVARFAAPPSAGGWLKINALFTFPAMKYQLTILALLFLSACAAPRKTLPGVSAGVTALADSLYTVALETEALYTLYAPVKPVSSVGQALRFPVARDSTQRAGQREASPEKYRSASAARIATMNSALNHLSNGTHRWFLVPFRAARDSNRYLQIIVANRARFDAMLQEQAPFFLQWGFAPGADPAVVLTTIENANRLDRFRAYGYLFGYPEHAVTFFVEAARAEDSTGVFVQRDFFHVPVAKAKTGHFTWAVPKGYSPTPADSNTYWKAMEVLIRYQSEKTGKRRKRGI
jgi:hypothetical protein